MTPLKAQQIQRPPQMRPAAQVPADQQAKVRKQQNMRMGQKIYVNQPQIRFPTQDKKIVSRLDFNSRNHALFLIAFLGRNHFVLDKSSSIKYLVCINTLEA